MCLLPRLFKLFGHLWNLRFVWLNVFHTLLLYAEYCEGMTCYKVVPRSALIMLHASVSLAVAAEGQGSNQVIIIKFKNNCKVT